ncbi:hypothetical protein ACFWBH_13440 [Streptomyces sp. NPDC059999]|uniref:hypothetical protein n=1 Tax=unclassified Streptomyces TaxID=2593676 RepID=UPI002E326CB7|nr:hypothetical protein [Streptomyces sp. NBC_01426]
MSLTQLPDYGAVLAEVREVRRAGIVRLRDLRLPVLTGMSAGPGEGDPGEPHFPAVERMLRTAVAALGGGTLQEAAEYSLGLARGTRDWPPADRRRRAAQVYGVSVERFRKHQELMVLGQLAEQLVRGVTGGRAEPVVTTGPARRLAPSHRRIEVTIGGGTHHVTLHVHAVDLLRDIDVIVSPSNTHFALPEPYKSSVAASLRRAGAYRDPAGRLVEDRIQDELRSWTARFAPGSLPVAPGTVAVTGAGALTRQGIRRIHHAAVAVPRPGTNDYDVLPDDVTRAVTRVFALLAEPGGPEAGTETDPGTDAYTATDPGTAGAEERPLGSVCLPLLGAGRGGLTPTESFAALWAAVEAELARGGPWDIHLLVRRAERADLIAALLAGAPPDGSPDPSSGPSPHAAPPAGRPT